MRRLFVLMLLLGTACGPVPPKPEVVLVPGAPIYRNRDGEPVSTPRGAGSIKGQRGWIGPPKHAVEPWGAKSPIAEYENGRKLRW